VVGWLVMFQSGGSLKSSSASGSSGRATTDNYQLTVHHSPAIVPLHTDLDSPVRDTAAAAQVRRVVVVVVAVSCCLLLLLVVVCCCC